MPIPRQSMPIVTQIVPPRNRGESYSDQVVDFERFLLKYTVPHFILRLISLSL